MDVSGQDPATANVGWLVMRTSRLELVKMEVDKRVAPIGL
jgi:hypothetical protein